MKKRLMIIICLMFLLTPILNVKALFSAACVDEWKDGVAYCWGVVTSDCWAYDSTTNMYVLLDENGHKIREVKELNDDPKAKKGTLKLTANVPEGIDDMTIKIDIMSDLYNYSFELNKKNNFTINEKVNADVYKVNSYIVTGYDGIENQLPNQFKVYENETTEYKIDYSKHQNKSKKEDKATKIKKIIIYISVGVIVVAFIIILLMFLKARSL